VRDEATGNRAEKFDKIMDSRIIFSLGGGVAWEVLERGGVRSWFGVFKGGIGTMRDDGPPGKDQLSLFRSENWRGSEALQALVGIGWPSERRRCDCAGVA
jgi:hypothetical protein